jgi:hypothetical protein
MTEKQKASKLNHTPGPWRYQEASDSYTHIIRYDKTDLSNLFLCQLSQDSSGVSEANARLIACAPEMIETLISIRKLIPIIGENSGVAFLHTRSTIDKLIERATNQKIEDLI